MFVTLVNLFPRLRCSYVVDATRFIIKNANSIEYLTYAGPKLSMYEIFTSVYCGLQIEKINIF